MLQILDNNRLRQAPSLQMNNLPVRECSLGYVIHFEILGPLNIFGMFKAKYFIFGKFIEHNYCQSHDK